MDDKKITPEELKSAWAQDVDELAEKVATAMNAAKAGRIIADTEELVRGAHAVFREQAYQASIDLLAKSMAPEAFSPSGRRAKRHMEE